MKVLNLLSFPIFKVLIPQSATWVTLIELIWTSLSQIHTHLPRFSYSLEGWFQERLNNWMRQYNISVEDHFFFVKIAKGGSDDLVGPIMLRLVGRGLWLSLSLIHEKELSKKCTEDSYKKRFFFQDKSSVGNTLPEKNGLNQNNQKRKNSLCQAVDG